MLIRELTPADEQYFEDLLDTLKNLSEVIPMNKAMVGQLIQKINEQDGHIFAGIKENRLVCTASIFIEQKILRGGAKAGHIEDVATRKGYEGKGYARQIIRHLIDYAKKRSCYKIVLYCKEGLVDFYSREGFTAHSVHMRYSLNRE